MDRTFLGVGGRRTPHKSNAAPSSADEEAETALPEALALHKASITPLEPTETRIWTKLARCARTIENNIKFRVINEFGVSLSRFDILARVYWQPDGLRMSELSKQLLITNGSLTGTVGGLVDDGLVERIFDESDRRSVRIRILPKGRKLYEAIEQRRREWFVGLLGDLSKTAKTEILESLTLLEHQLSERWD